MTETAFAQSEPFIKEVVKGFCSDISGRLNIDMGWALQERAVNIEKAADDYVKSLESTNFKQNGSRNDNPNRFGNQFEERDAALRNFSEAANNTGIRHSSTDQLYIEKRSGTKQSKQISDAAQYNDPSTDIVSTKRGIVIEKHQHKVIQNSADLGKERYLENNDFITVPYEDIEKHQKYWESQKNKGNPYADAVLQKLKPAMSSRKAVTLEGTAVESFLLATYSDPKEAKKKLKRLADHKLEIEARGIQAASAVGTSTMRVAEATSTALMSYIAGRIIEEIYDHWNGNEKKSLSERIRSIITDAKAKFIDQAKASGLSELKDRAFNFIKDMVFKFFREIKELVSKGGEYLTIITKEIWSYITGKTTNFSTTINNIVKALSGIAIVAICSSINTYLKSLHLPDFLCILITAFVSAFLTVSIFKLIDQLAKTVLSVLAAADAAKVRREEIENICEKAFPLIEQKTAELDTLIATEVKERRDLFSCSFIDIQNAISANSIEAISSAYTGMYDYFEVSLPFTSESEFDDFMSSDDAFVL